MSILEEILTTCEKISKKYETNQNDILVKIGVVCGIGSVIAACIATHKSEKIIKETKEKIEVIMDEPAEDPKETQKEIIQTGLEGGAKVAAMFIGVGGLLYASQKSFIKSNDNLKAEAIGWAGIAAGYAQKLINYRQIMAGRIGKEAEEEAYYGVEKKTVPVLEKGKIKKKKVRTSVQAPANHNILCFAPWTTELYTDEEALSCPGVNYDRIRHTFGTLNTILKTSKTGFLSTNDIADAFQITNSAEWYAEGIVRGDGPIRFSTREVYELYEGRYIPIWYIEINTTPLLPERLSSVLPEAPTYDEQRSTL